MLQRAHVAICNNFYLPKLKKKPYLLIFILFFEDKKNMDIDIPRYTSSYINKIVY